MNTTILVACHKQTSYPQDSCYLPIHVGHADSSSELGFQGDDDGENISNKNYCYCELTALYWAWKNLKNVDVVGLCHYRRYFDFHKQCIRFLPDTDFPLSAINELDFSIDEKTIQSVLKGGVVVPQALSWNSSLEQQYCMGHISDDYRLLRDVFYNSQNNRYKKAFEEVLDKGYKFRPYNMMVMRWSDFDAYCSWLFGLLFEVEKKTDIGHYSSFQKRIYGFLSERLFNVWLYAEKKSLIERPVMFMSENCKQRFPHKYAPRKTVRMVKWEWHCRIINWHYRKTK